MVVVAGENKVVLYPDERLVERQLNVTQGKPEEGFVRAACGTDVERAAGLEGCSLQCPFYQVEGPVFAEVVTGNGAHRPVRRFSGTAERHAVRRIKKQHVRLFLPICRVGVHQAHYLRYIRAVATEQAVLAELPEIACVNAATGRIAGSGRRSGLLRS